MNQIVSISESVQSCKHIYIYTHIFICLPIRFDVINKNKKSLSIQYL